MAYARVLLDAQRPADALHQLELLTKERPAYAPAWLTLGLLQLQENRLEPAQMSLGRYLEVTPNPTSDAQQRAQTEAFLGLSQIAEKRKNFALAEKWLERIELIDADYRGYWQERGWTNDATIQIISTIETPRGTVTPGADGIVPLGLMTASVVVDGIAAEASEVSAPPSADGSTRFWAIPWLLLSALLLLALAVAWWVRRRRAAEPEAPTGRRVRGAGPDGSGDLVGSVGSAGGRD